MPSLAGSDSQARLDTLNNKVYAEQAEWLLNAKWGKMFENDPDAREAVWKYTEAIEKMDKDKGKKGAALPEIRAHVYIEKQAEAVTWADFRDYMRSQDFGFDKRKNMSLTDFFVFVFKLDWKELADAESFDPAAAERVEKAKAQFAAAQESADKAKLDHETAQAAAEQAQDSLDAAKAAEEEVRLCSVTLVMVAAMGAFAIPALRAHPICYFLVILSCFFVLFYFMTVPFFCG